MATWDDVDTDLDEWMLVSEMPEFDPMRLNMSQSPSLGGRTSVSPVVEHGDTDERGGFLDDELKHKVVETENSTGDRRWVLEGSRLLHQNDGQPAIVMANGDMHYYYEGKRHRFGGDPAVELVNGVREWWRWGVRYRDGDNPVIERPVQGPRRGVKIWMLNGVIGRAGGRPAIEYSDGVQTWFENGQRGRHEDAFMRVYYMNGKKGRVGNDLPAVEWKDGKREWWQNGQEWRVDNRPNVVLADGTQQWVRGGRLHRNREPAVIYPDGTKEWYCYGLLESGVHLLEMDPLLPDEQAVEERYGPAQIFPDGEKRWYSHGQLGRPGDPENLFPSVVYPDGSVEYWKNGKQVPLRMDTPWTRLAHGMLRGKAGHKAVNHMLGTFLIGYTKACNLDELEGTVHWSLVEDMLENGTFDDYSGGRLDA